MTTLLEQTLAPLPSRLPPVERRAVMPAGFAAAAMAAGIKASGRPDLGIVSASSGESTRGVPVAGIFTTNALPAAPVRLSKKHLSATLRSGVGCYGWTRGLVSTSGSANAATGEAGDVDQAEIAQHFASALGTRPEQTLALSTGVIGTRLPVDAVAAGIDELVSRLSSEDAALAAVAEAICTTDSRIKVATVSLPVDAGRDRAPTSFRETTSRR